MPDDKIVSKTKKLVALALSSNKNEARNAAVAACKLIQEHKLLERSAAPAATVFDTVQKVREAAADPNVQATIMSAADLFSKVVDLAGKARRA